jgi:hypothetical protein
VCDLDDAGVEHRLHRKKILSSIAKLKYAEAEREKAFMLRNITKQVSQ